MLNVVALVGRIVADPELRQTPSDIPVVRFSIAVARSYVRQGEERQTDFFDIVAWRGNAEFVCNHFKKGNLIAVDGTIQTRTYQGNDGIKRKAVEIIASNVHFVESKAASQESLAYASGNDGDFKPNNKNTSEEAGDNNDLPF
ncbi:MAG: single-stranded DNA-binding protein [Oscillospiraceae bacterium]|jgi:single-strand DNA-binding protein|nr:single-stranded DNA-binding protein [Oscillospiraceae bacterium]